MRGGSGPGVSISAPMTTGSLRGRPGGRSSDFPYIVLNNIMRVVKEQQPKIVSQEFDNLCTMVFAIREGRAAELIEKLKKAGGSVPEEQ